MREEWWYPARTLRSDEAGRLHVLGPLGRYAVSSPQGTTELALTRDGDPVTVRVG